MRYIRVSDKKMYVEARIYRHGYKVNKAFSYKKCGSREAAIDAAIAWRDEQLLIANVVAPVPVRKEPIKRTPRQIGNDSWNSMSEEPKPRPASQLLLWVKPKQEGGMP